MLRKGEKPRPFKALFHAFIAKTNSQARCENFHRIAISESTCELAFAMSGKEVLGFILCCISASVKEPLAVSSCSNTGPFHLDLLLLLHAIIS